MQSRKQTAYEVIINVGSGLLLTAATMQFVLGPALGLPIEVHTNIIITIVLTSVSFVRNYMWRRIFNYLHSKRR